MPAVDVDVVATNDDGYVRMDTDALVANTTINPGDAFEQQRNGFIRFVTTIPQGATCSGFKLNVASAGEHTMSGTVRIRGLAEASSAQITGGLDLSGRSTTTALTDQSFGTMTTGEAFEIDVNSIVQEIVNLPSFSGVIQFRLYPEDNFDEPYTLYSFDSNGSNSNNIPNLSGTYEEGGGAEVLIRAHQSSGGTLTLNGGFQ